VGKNSIAALAKEYAPVNAANDPNRTNAQWPGMVQSIYQGLVGGGGGAGQDKLAGLDPGLVAKLGVLQEQFGKFNVKSGYRSPAKNVAAGGAPKSQHMHGKAVDIDVSHMSKEEQLALINAASALGIGGIGVYGNTLHFDVASKRAWGPSHRRGSVPAWAEKAVQQHEANTPTTSSLVPTGSRLKDVIKGMNMQQRMQGGIGGSNIANMSPTININGVAPGRESLMAKKTALAMRDPVDHFLHQIKEARASDMRTGYV
jgi:hypothetical protein